MFRNLKPTNELLEKWLRLGYEPETWKLVVCAPLVQTAWADGFMQAVEKREILARARSLGIKAGSAAGARLADWLDFRPEDSTFDAAREILAGFLRSLPPKQHKKLSVFVLKSCLEIARSSRGIGLIRKNHPAVRPEERIQINDLSKFLSLQNASSL